MALPYRSRVPADLLAQTFLERALAGGFPNAEELGRAVWPWAVRVGLALLTLFGFQLAGRIVAGLIRRVARRYHDAGRSDLLGLAARLVGAAALVFGSVTALGTLGVNVAPLVAGLGLGGFALGFALRDALSNVLAGTLVLFYRPFRRGDFIEVDNKSGTVVEIDLRYTTLQGEGRRILIPNSTLFTTAIQVVDRPPGGMTNAK